MLTFYSRLILQPADPIETVVWLAPLRRLCAFTSFQTRIKTDNASSERGKCCRNDPHFLSHTCERRSFGHWATTILDFNQKKALAQCEPQLSRFYFSPLTIKIILYFPFFTSKMWACRIPTSKRREQVIKRYKNRRKNQPTRFTSALGKKGKKTCIIT